MQGITCGRLAERVITQISKLDVDVIVPKTEAKAFAEQAMHMTGFQNCELEDVAQVVEALSDMGANMMICMTAACLLLDYKTLENYKPS